MFWPRAVVERRHDAEPPFSPPQTPLERLVRHPDGASNRGKGRRFPVGEQHPRPLDPTRRFRPRPGKPLQFRRLVIRNHQPDRPSGNRHDPPPRSERKIHRTRCNAPPEFRNPPAYARIQGIDALGRCMAHFGIDARLNDLYQERYSTTECTSREIVLVALTNCKLQEDTGEQQSARNERACDKHGDLWVC